MVSLSAATATVLEDEGPVSLTVRLSVASSEPVTVAYATSDGTATAGEDYVEASDTLRFAPGVTEQSVSVEITDDTVYEGDETFTVTLTDPSNATLGETASAEVTIEDDEDPPVVSLSAAFATVLEEEGPIALTARLSVASSEPVTVNYATSDSTATAGEDYEAASGTLTFTDEATSQTISVSINGRHRV